MTVVPARAADAITEVTRVVSGVTTVEPSGALSVPAVETSVPPVMIRVPWASCRVKVPSALVVAEASPASYVPLPLASANTKAPAM